MASVYTPGKTTLVRHIDVSMDTRESPAVVHLMQGEDAIPVIAAHLYFDGQPYAVPESAQINVRACKPDKLRIYNPGLGVSEDRTVAYIEVTQQMTAAPGTGSASVEVVLDGVAMTGAFVLEIDENPAPDPVIESAPEYDVLQDTIKKADDAAANANRAASEADAAEEARKRAEQGRVDAEKGRATAEEQRAVSEADRESAEGLRESAEQRRDAAEQDRADAEQERAAGEAAREKAEQSRVDAEQGRDDAEQARVSAEANRVKSESARVEAEKARDQQMKANTEIVDKYTEFVAEVESLPPSSDPYANVEQSAKQTKLLLGIPTSNFAYATFWIDLVTRQLMMRVPNGFSAISFAIKNRELVVRING